MWWGIAKDVVKSCFGKMLESLKKGQCCQLSNAMVRSYRGVKYLSIGRDGEVRSTDNIGEVADVHLDEQEIVRKVVEGEIDGLTNVL